MKQRITTLLLLVAILGAFLGFGFVGKAHAAGPKCYNNLGPGLVDCFDPQGVFASPAFNVFGFTYKDDKCYELSNVNGKIVVIEATTDCNAGRFAGQPTPSTSSVGKFDSPKFAKNDCNTADIDKNNCGIIKYLTIAINLLSALVGVAVVGMIIVGGIQYSSAGDDPQKVSAAKTRIFNAILALVVFIFMYAFLQWVVPGGIF